MRRPESPARLSAAVDYALQIAGHYLRYFDELQIDPYGANVLELGPGTDLGPQLILASHGVRMTVADRFLHRWSARYHPAFYRLLRSRWRGKADAIDAVLAAGRYPPEVITRLQQPAETLAGLADAQFDLVLSNAVLEHIYDLPAVCRSLARVTKPGGMNSHQIDFRDHRDFSKPLEFLAIGSKRFSLRRDQWGNRWRSGQGNRWRSSQIVQQFSAERFEILAIQENDTVDETYLRSFLPVLRASTSVYRDCPESDLRMLAARFILRRRP